MNVLETEMAIGAGFHLPNRKERGPMSNQQHAGLRDGLAVGVHDPATGGDMVNTTSCVH